MIAYLTYSIYFLLFVASKSLILISFSSLVIYYFFSLYLSHILLNSYIIFLALSTYDDCDLRGGIIFD